MWNSRWTSWAPIPNKPTVSVDIKQHFNQQKQKCTQIPWHLLHIYTSSHYSLTDQGYIPELCLLSQMYLSTSNDKCPCKAVHNLSIYKHKFSINNQLKLTEDKIYDKIVKVEMGKKSMNLLNLKRTTTLISSNKTKRNLQQKEKKKHVFKSIRHYHRNLPWRNTSCYGSWGSLVYPGKPSCPER